MNNSDEIINSLDGMRKAEPPQHFYAGIRAKTERQMPAEKTRSFVLRPAFVLSVLFIFLLANITALTLTDRTEKTDTETGSGAQAFAQEYHLSVQTSGQ